MNSDISTPSNPSNSLGASTIPPISSSNVSFNDEPLDLLLDKKVHEMTPEELATFVKRCALLRSSAQSRRAAIRGDGTPKAPKVKKKSNVEKALELLMQINQQKKE